MIQSFLSLGFLAIATSLTTLGADNATECPTVAIGETFKAEHNAQVYILNEQNQRAIFPNADVFFSWFNDFSKVKTIPGVCVEKYSAGPMVLYRPGSRLLKTASPDLYAILPEHKIAKIQNEEVARALYGDEWNTKVRALDDEQFSQYRKIDKIISETTPHDGMFVEQNGILYYVDNGNLIEIGQNDTVAKNIEILRLKDDNILIMPVLPSDENQSAEKIHMKNLLNSMMERFTEEQKNMEQAIDNMNTVKSVHQYSEIYLDNFGADTYVEWDNPVADSFYSGRIVADSLIDKTVCDTPKISTELSVERINSLEHYTRDGFINIYATEQDNELTTYFQFRLFGVVESENAAAYELLQDKWVRYNKAEFDNGYADLFSEFLPKKEPIIAGEGSTPKTCNSSVLLGGALEDTGSLVVTKNFGNETIDKQDTFHYGFNTDNHTLTSLFSVLGGALDSKLGMEVLAPFEALSDFTKDMELTNAEVWIGVEDRRPHAISLTFNDSDKEAKNPKKIVYEVELNNFNDEYAIEAPAESTKAFEILLDIEEKKYETKYIDPSFLIETYDILPVDPDVDHITGYPYVAPDAGVTIVEYVDFECPYCKDFHKTMKEIVNAYAYDVRWVIRQYPLASIHERADYFANLTECAADQNKFWESVDVVYEFPKLKISEYAKKLNINETRLSRCITEKKHKDKINRDIEDGNNVGVQGVPHSVLMGPDGSMIQLNGSVNYDTVASAIDLLLTPALSPKP